MFINMHSYIYIWFKCPKCPLGDNIYIIFSFRYILVNAYKRTNFTVR